MLLLTSGSAGSQALGVAGWQLRSTQGRDFWGRILRELQLTTIGGILSSILAAILAWFLFHSILLSIAIGLGFGLTLLVASVCGLAFPNLLQRLHLRGSLITAPLLDPVIAVISLSVFLAVSLTLIDKLHI
jgi:magnesium transporter